jgi:hypothetical protein
MHILVFAHKYYFVIITSDSPNVGYRLGCLPFVTTLSLPVQSLLPPSTHYVSLVIFILFMSSCTAFLLSYTTLHALSLGLLFLAFHICL